MSPLDQRLLLLSAGYDPIPCNGKKALLDDWAARPITNPEEIRLWSSPGGFPNALETGIRTKFTPAVDIDIMDPEVAEAAEQLTYEFFEERDVVLPRIGQWPKRIMLVRTDEPFKKLVRTFVPNGPYNPEKPPKIEILGEGQQVIAFGTHPDTRRPYDWPRGEPGKIPREDLPYVREADMV